VDPDAIGPYPVRETLGQGGMGVVYRARDERLGRDVAIKLLEDQGSELRRARFAREARALARLRHPNVVTVHAAGDHEGRPFLVMDYVPGRSLHDRVVAEGPLHPVEAAALVRAIARAVHEAHRLGLVHRDVKPANVLVDADGAPLLTDFGLCQDAAGGESLTAPKTTLGTPGYMAPEQVRDAKEAGPPADVFGLGATLYALVAGRPPFAGDELAAILSATLDGRWPPLADVRPGTDPALDRVLAGCLALEPERRYPDAAALADDLDRLLAGEPVRFEPPPPPRPEPTPGAALSELMEAPLDEAPDAPAPRGAPTITRADGAGPADWLVRGDAAYRDRRLGDALAAYDRAVAAAPDDVKARCKRAVVRRLRGDPVGAIEDADRALALRPDEVRALVSRAAAREDLMDFPRAIADYERALDLLPTDEARTPKVEAALARARERLGDTRLRRGHHLGPAPDRADGPRGGDA